MALSPNEIRSRAISFIHDHKDDKYEKGESQLFWRDFFYIWGISAKKVGIFEERAKTLRQTTGFIDYFWPKTILIEQKSKGEDLDKAYKQALDYCLTGGIPDEELPSYICVCDFERLRLVNFTDQEKTVEFKIIDLLDHLQRFNFLLGYEQREYKDEDPVNIKAAELMGKLHDELERNGFQDHPLKLMLVRLMFCFFADDTGIFNKDDFLFFLKERTKEDGSDLGLWIAQFFQVLNTPNELRQANLDEDLAKFPYVNGQLFEEPIPFAQFDLKLRAILIQACEFNWSLVSPAIFGSLFQSVMNKAERRELGAHYTNEKNILKTIHGLFLDELIEEFESVKKKKSIKSLEDLLIRIRKIKILDPACGCGNFLILSYRELRLLEISILKVKFSLEASQGTYQRLSIEWIEGLDVDMLYGIEIEEFPALIAKTAIWIMDHLMNRIASNEFGEYYVRLPLKKAPNIIKGNALRLKWEEVVQPDELSYILGNPPFIGTAYQNQSQKEDLALVLKDVESSGMLDYVTGWYVKACEYSKNKGIKIAFVSTNSIVQGEQANILWKYLFEKYKISIFFAHETFRWTSEAKGKAAVHVVIIGIQFGIPRIRYLSKYENVNSEPIKVKVKELNGQLKDAASVFLKSRSKPLCKSPIMVSGSAINDDGHLTISPNEKYILLNTEPNLEEYIRPLYSGGDFINKKERYCFWLKGVDPRILNNSSILKQRLEKVRNYRSLSEREKTRESSEFPSLFTEERQPTSHYLFIPKVSSENRKYIPIGFLDAECIITDKAFFIENAEVYHFGILTSLMHNSWMRRVAGRLESRYSYSNSLVYNNFPWPEDLTEKKKVEIELLAQSVLDARAQFPDSSLADLYDPLTMPKVLRDAHNKLDKAVDKAYRSKPFESESERVEFLFELYEKYTNTLTSQIKVPKKKGEK
ncbi:class I SAM-dependent DNA methyltransferase [Leptospira bandrabouensis]|uniref:site-specific DNA-methyltransferase (adenine-specific) n=1 Tax=Leptospira bandrabouensis TaxID=2484903 RepID=A0A6H3NMG2_9LEPT|nr:DNA methyltransferase [Leptospira bandrabouensis]TGN13452.1 class I SAM-dependent DNA methyltransferase [Leptospira bandrabouensis]